MNVSKLMTLSNGEYLSQFAVVTFTITRVATYLVTTWL